MPAHIFSSFPFGMVRTMWFPTGISDLPMQFQTYYTSSARYFILVFAEVPQLILYNKFFAQDFEWPLESPLDPSEFIEIEVYNFNKIFNNRFLIVIIYLILFTLIAVNRPHPNFAMELKKIEKWQLCFSVAIIYFTSMQITSLTSFCLLPQNHVMPHVSHCFKTV